ncbi:MAG: hypothetical protein PHE89_01290 [Alphaproteobacteria bacterium]|nr:hypothetical protein [Alphaproteobacteria bacterium]
MEIIKSKTTMLKMNQGTLTIDRNENNLLTLRFMNGYGVWQRSNIKRYTANKFYFTFTDINGALSYFFPSILMREELIGLPFLQKYYLAKDPHHKDEMIISTFMQSNEYAYVNKRSTYSIIHNENFLILGTEGYRKIIPLTERRLGDEITLSPEALYETTIINNDALLHIPLKKELFLVRAHNVLERGLFTFPDL